MHEEGCQGERPHSGDTVSPLPIALYVSDDLIFELYNGGLPDRYFAICWKRLLPTLVREDNK